jgi:hypothetical protein
MGRILPAAGLLAPLLLLAIVPAQLAVPAEASPNPFPQMALSFSQSGIKLNPTFSQFGVASVQGTVSIDKLPGERFPVYITGTIDTGWGVGIAPSVILLMNNVKIAGFTVTVSCPPGTPANMVGDLRIEARGTGTTFDPIVVGHVVVTVKPFYMIRIDSPNPYKEVTPGSRLSFAVELQNYGNSMDSYDILIENQEELAGMGWTVSFSTPVVTKVRSGDSKTVRLSVLAPQKSTIYKAEGSLINVKAVSQNARDEGTLVDMLYPFVVYERGTFIDPFFTGWASLLIITFGSISVYILRRVWRWNKNRPRPVRDDLDDYDEDEWDEEYEDDEYDDGEYEDDDDYDEDGK